MVYIIGYTSLFYITGDYIIGKIGESGKLNFAVNYIILCSASNNIVSVSIHMLVISSFRVRMIEIVAHQFIDILIEIYLNVPFVYLFCDII